METYAQAARTKLQIGTARSCKCLTLLVLSDVNASCRENNRLKLLFEGKIAEVKLQQRQDLWLLASKVAQQDAKMAILKEANDTLIQTVKTSHDQAQAIKVSL